MRFDEIPTAWRGHEQFADFLVRAVKPRVIVELGCDYGFSTIAFARPNIGTVFAIDWFKGDVQTGERNAEQQFFENLDDANAYNVWPIIADFDSAATKWAQNPPIQNIDILHIDGLHTYEAVKHDFQTWTRFVKPNGFVLLHDTQSFPNDVGRFFNEIDWPKFQFVHSAGLGVVCRP
jgi:predicted O-methyltransferase YrrM